MFKLSLFILGLILGSSVFAATGIGHAQTELAQPLTITHANNVDFGNVAIDPAAGPQTVTVSNSGQRICPETYVCSGAYTSGLLYIDGAPDSYVYLNLNGSTATLSDGAGNTFTFDPYLATGIETYAPLLPPNGRFGAVIFGSIYLSGNEPAGIYNTTNTGGSGFNLTVTY